MRKPFVTGLGRRPPKQPPPQKPSMLRRWLQALRLHPARTNAWNFLVAFGVLFGLWTGVASYRPHISIQPEQVPDSDQGEPMFLISNSGPIPLHELTFSCSVDESMQPTKAGWVKIPKAPNDTTTQAGDNINPEKVLRVGESVSKTCIGDSPVPNMILYGVNTTFRVTYKDFFSRFGLFPTEFTVYSKGRLQNDGSFTWLLVSENEINEPPPEPTLCFKQHGLPLPATP